MGIVPRSEVWKIEGAIYGLAESPLHWALHRDEKFSQMTWRCDAMKLHLKETNERHLWQILDGEGKVHGYLCSYVDDLLVTGVKAVVESTMKVLGETWTCSTPEVVNEESSVRFCGYELKSKAGGGLFLSQPSYIGELLKKYQVTSDEVTPCPKVTNEPDEDYDVETLKRAQQLAGELLWVQSRTRPDLSYVTGAMARWLHRRPGFVCQLGEHALRYLHRTPELTLVYNVCENQEWDDNSGLHTRPSMNQINIFVDSSFSLEHEQFRSITGTLLEQGGATLMWTSLRQPFIAASTAEAEIIGYAEAQQQSESLDELLKLMHVEPCHHLYGDSKAALALDTQESGPWRTRHLRLRAARLREVLRESREQGGDGAPKWSPRRKQTGGRWPH